MGTNRLIQGSSYSDERGKLNFFNFFDMAEVVRFYEIVPASTDVIRAWQGHQYEKKWFYCNSGAFYVKLIKIDNFDSPSDNLICENFLLDSDKPVLLEISGGYATGFKAAKDNSRLLVFSNFTLEESKLDDFKYPLSKWSIAW